MSYWNKIYKFAWMLSCILALISLVTIFLPRWKNLRALQARKQERQQENLRTEEATRILKRKQEQFVSDPSFVERTAREEGMVKPNETVFKFTNQQTQASSEVTQ